MSQLSNMGGGDVLHLFLLRHGEGIHNEACQLRSPPESRESVLREAEFFDAELSNFGRRQAAEVSQCIPQLVKECIDNQNGNTSAEVSGCLRPLFLLFSSPLRRTLQTTNLVLPKVKKVEVVDYIREWAGSQPCDARLPLSKSKILFSPLFPNGFTVHGDVDEDLLSVNAPRETAAQVILRCQRFLHFMASRISDEIHPEGDNIQRNVVVVAVTHAAFVRQLLTTLDVGELRTRALGNCQWRHIEIDLKLFLNMALQKHLKTECEHPGGLPWFSSSAIEPKPPLCFPIQPKGQFTDLGDVKPITSVALLTDLKTFEVVAPFTVYVYPPIVQGIEDDNILLKFLNELIDLWNYQTSEIAGRQNEAELKDNPDVLLHPSAAVAWRLAMIRQSPIPRAFCDNGLNNLSTIVSGFPHSGAGYKWLEEFAPRDWVTSGVNVVRCVYRLPSGASDASSQRNGVTCAANVPTLETVIDFELINKQLIDRNGLILHTLWRDNLLLPPSSQGRPLLATSLDDFKKQFHLYDPELHVMEIRNLA